MANQLSFGLVLDLGKNGKTIVIAANSPVTVPTPKGFSVLVDPDLEEQDVVVLANGKIKFPKNGALVALVTVDRKFKQVRVEVAELSTLRSEIVEAISEIDVKAVNKRLESLFNSLPENGPTGQMLTRLFEVSLTPLRQFRDDLKEKLADVDLEAIGAELAAIAKANQEKLPTSATDDDD